MELNGCELTYQLVCLGSNPISCICANKTERKEKEETYDDKQHSFHVKAISLV